MITKKTDLSPIDFEGLKIFDYTAGRSEQSSFAVIQIPPGAVHGLSRSNRSDKYYYTVKGEILFTLENETGRLEEKPFAEGDFLIVPKGKKFNYSNISGQTAELILVHTPSFDIEFEEFL